MSVLLRVWVLLRMGTARAHLFSSTRPLTTPGCCAARATAIMPPNELPAAYTGDRTTCAGSGVVVQGSVVAVRSHGAWMYGRPSSS